MLKNKYSKWYFSIIEKAKIREKIDLGEKHHIIPLSLGGLNIKDNLVFLTFREHFLCHWLLIKITEGKEKMKMCFAFHCMKRANKFHNRNLFGWQFELCKKYNTKESNPWKIRSINKGKVTVKDENGNIFHVEKYDQKYISGELLHISRGMKRNWSKEDIDERYRTRRGRKYSQEEYEFRAKTRKAAWNKEKGYQISDGNIVWNSVVECMKGLGIHSRAFYKRIKNKELYYV